MTSYLYIDDDRASREVMELLMGVVMKIDEYTILEPSENILGTIKGLTPSPDVFLFDIHMKPYSGFDMLTFVKTEMNSKPRKVIALTASVMNEEIQQLKAAGFDGAISKPLDAMSFPDLLKRISEGETIWHGS